MSYSSMRGYRGFGRCGFGQDADAQVLVKQAQDHCVASGGSPDLCSQAFPLDPSSPLATIQHQAAVGLCVAAGGDPDLCAAMPKVSAPGTGGQADCVASGGQWCEGNQVCMEACPSGQNMDQASCACIECGPGTVWDKQANDCVPGQPGSNTALLIGIGAVVLIGGYLLLKG